MKYGCAIWTRTDPQQCKKPKFMKKCRASCHEQYPMMEYCKDPPSWIGVKVAELEERLDSVLRA